MKRFFPYAILIFSLIYLTCGKKGPIYPPVEKIPKNVEGFKIIQRGSAVVLTWRNPTEYIDGSPMPNLSGIEIWFFIEEKEDGAEFAPFSEEEFIEQAEILEEISKEKFLHYLVNRENLLQGMIYSYPLKPDIIDSWRLSFGLKVKDDRGRFSDFSHLLSVIPQVVALPPEKVSASIHEDKIEINWTPPRKNINGSEPPVLSGYNIYRSSGKEEATRLNPQPLNENRYEDTNFIFGDLYTYFIRSSSSESPPFLESRDSQSVDILAKDSFPPEVPVGLVAIAGERAIVLSWDPNREKDLAGYKVLRRQEGNEEFVELTPEGVQENSYSDALVDRNMKYEYAIVAFDGFGNKSKKSKSVTVMIKGEVYENLPF